MLKKIACLFLLAYPLFAQQIKVVDAHTGKPIHNVKVVSVKSNETYYTNTSGKVKIKKHNSSSLYVITSPSYVAKKIGHKDLEKQIKLEPEYEALESLVMSVARNPEKKDFIPEQIEVVTKARNNNVSPQTSADLLAVVNGLRVQKSQLGGGSPVIRGLEANRVLLVVDGVRLNNAIYRSGHLQNAITISPFALERVEVVFGPNSVTYGSDALGGVVHYYTKQLNYTANVSHKNSAFYRHSTVNNEQSLGYSLLAKHKNWASYTNVSYSKFGDLRMGKNRLHGYENWGKVFQYSKNTIEDYYEDPILNTDLSLQKNTGYKQLDVLQKLMFPVSKTIDFILNTQFSTTSDIPNFGKLNDVDDFGNLRFAEWRYGPQQRFLISSRLKFKNHPSKFFKNGTFTLAYQNVLESRINRRFGSLDRLSRKENVDVFSVNADFYKSLTKNGHRKLYYGAELVYNKVNSLGIGERLSVKGYDVLNIARVFEIDSRYPNAGSKYGSAALYTMYRQKLNQKQVLNAGLRLTNTLLQANWRQGVQLNIPNRSITLSSSALTGSLGYTFKFTSQNKIDILLSKGFRAPNVDDVGKIRVKSGKITVPNTSLKPEHLYSIELGFNQKSKASNLDFRAYYTLLDDYIARVPNDEFGSVIVYDQEEFENQNIIANTNIGKAYIYGATVSMEHNIQPNIKANASVTYTKGALYGTHKPLSSIPPLFGNIVIGLFKQKYKIALECRFALAKALKDYNLIEGIDNLEETPNNQGSPAWYIFSLNSNVKLHKDLDLKLQLQNILDVHYKEFASSISSPGRNLVASVAYSF